MIIRLEGKMIIAKHSITITEDDVDTLKQIIILAENHLSFEEISDEDTAEVRRFSALVRTLVGGYNCL